MRLIKYVILFSILTFGSRMLFAQGGYEDLLFTEVEVENPVYMPVIGIGAGFINYYGELENDTKNILQGTPTFRLNLYQPLGKKHYWRVNINVIYGKISGYERSFEDTSKNLNFSDDIFTIGTNLEYNLGNIFKGDRKIRPFLSLGGEYITFSTMNTDLENSEGKYIYLPDGTIRVDDVVAKRDYIYETNFQTLNRFGRDKQTTSVFSLVGDAGLDFKITNRVSLRLAGSLHYTFTDEIDDVSNENTKGRIGDSKNDMFSFTYVTLNIDLFSEAKTKIMESLFLDVSGDFDYTIIADSDNDGVLDLADNCFNTPEGIEVDSVGCPFDDDKDGVPNFKDNDLASVTNAIVDENGVELTPDQILANLLQDIQAVMRTDAYMIPIGLGWSKYSQMSNVEIPEKFKPLDIDNDGYISFDELLKAINNFFDSDGEFKPDDIYELNDFFFAQ